MSNQHSEGTSTFQPPDRLSAPSNHEGTAAAATAAHTVASMQPPTNIHDGVWAYESTTEEATANYVSMELGQDSRLDVTPSPDYYDDVTLAPSIVSSVISADGIYDTVGFMVNCSVTLVGEMSRGVFFPTLWPLVESLGGNSVTLGYAVGAFSAGRIVMVPIFGSLSVAIGYKKTLGMSVSILVVGFLLYTQIQNVGHTQALILAQFVLGMGSGTLGVTRAFVAEVTAKRNRTTYMAWITSVEFAGSNVTPFFGAILTKLFGDYNFQLGPFRLNMYTAPAYLMVIMCTAVLYCLIRFFNDQPRMAIRKKKVSKQTAIDELADLPTLFGLTTVYTACMFGFFVLNVAVKGILASFETVGINYAATHFDLLPQQTGSVVAACGTIGVVILLQMGSISRWFSDIQLMCGGMVLMAGALAALACVQEGDNPKWIFMSAFFVIYAIGYPISNTAVIGLFSKIVGRRPQGVLQGWFAWTGALSRMLFPILAGYVVMYQDATVMFIILTIILLMSTASVLYCKRPIRVLSI